MAWNPNLGPGVPISSAISAVADDERMAPLRSPIARQRRRMPIVAQTRQMIPAGAYFDRDCFVAVLLAMTSTYAVIASEAKQSRRGLPGSKRLVHAARTREAARRSLLLLTPRSFAASPIAPTRPERPNAPPPDCGRTLV
jgi:hypothetical protein